MQSSDEIAHAFSAEEMTQRIARIRHAMRGQALDALVLSDAANVRFATGFRGEPRTLLITTDTLILFTSFRTLPWAEAQTHDIPLNTQANPLKVIADTLGSSPCQLGVDRSMSVVQFERYGRELAAHQLRPCSVVESVRRRKSPAEVERLKQSQVINEAVFEAILPQLRAGMTERAVQGLMLTEMAQRTELSGPSFSPIVAAGANAWEIHHLPDYTVLKQGDLVILDLGVFWAGYASDMTRTISLGTPTDHQAEIYELVREAKNQAIAAIQPGKSTRDIDAVARSIISDAGHGRVFTHGLGHSIGLETHDPGLNLSPNTETVLLEEGMAFTVEPGIYLQDLYGVRIEDVIVVAADGCENLTTTTDELITL